MSSLEAIQFPDVMLYLMLLLLMIFAVNTVQQMNQADDPTYSQVRTLFEQEKVKYFMLNGKDLSLQVREEETRSVRSTTSCRPVRVLFGFMSSHRPAARSGVLEGYDYKGWALKGLVVPVLPYLVLLLVMAAFWYMMYLRQSGGNSGGSPGPSRFGPRPHPHFLADQGKRSPSRMWPGAEERRRSAGDRGLSPGSSEVSLSGRPHPQGVLLVGPPGHRQDPDRQGGGR